MSTNLPISGIFVILAIIPLFGKVFFNRVTNHIGRVIIHEGGLLLILLSKLDFEALSHTHISLWYSSIIMPVREILRLGNPQLNDVSEEVTMSDLDMLPSVIKDLHDTMMEFRQQYGVGRAIAAPQIGLLKRIIYMHIDRPVVFLNPILKDLSEDMIEIWDDCMCFPDLLVRIQRHRSCTIEYVDQKWKKQVMQVEDDISELLQHEYDHLDGILAISRAIDGNSFAYRDQLNSI